MNLELKNVAWQEKYRPNTVKNIVLNDKEKILKYLETPESIPNFLFSSRIPGTGKTTLAKAIINDLKCDYLILNSSDDRKIETVREKIKDFIITKSSNDKRKCVFLDEADGMINISQEALRNMMETYSKNVFFILTCNYIDKIIAPLRSRCIEIEFTKPIKNDINKYLTDICINENINFDDNAISKLIDIYYPSIRNMVNFLQDLKTQNKHLTIDNIKIKDTEFEYIYKLIIKLDFNSLKTYILENNIDCLLFNRWLFDKMVNENNFGIVKVAKIIRIISDNEYKMKLGADNQIIFISSLIDIIMVLKNN